jgi:hypothetical protein
MSTPSAPSSGENDVQAILRRYDINGKYYQLLNNLKGYKLVLICDDSTSMRESLQQGHTKWIELKNACQIVVDIATCLQIECDILFLNREGIRNIQHSSQLVPLFANLPSGSTPLTRCFEMALNFNRNETLERKLNVIIFTDGQPTSDNLNTKDSIKEFKNSLKNRQPMNRIFVTICACTDDEYSLEYLNDWDRKIPNLDVVDDYLSEKREIYETKRNHEAFSFGDYIAKIMIGPSCKEIDQSDEQSHSKCLIF